MAMSGGFAGTCLVCVLRIVIAGRQAVGDAWYHADNQCISHASKAGGACAFMEGPVDGAPYYLSDVLPEVLDEYPLLAEVVPAGLALVLFLQAGRTFRRRSQGKGRFAAVPVALKQALDLEGGARPEAAPLAPSAAGEVAQVEQAEQVQQVDQAAKRGGRGATRGNRGCRGSRSCGARTKETLALDLDGETRSEAVLPTTAAAGGAAGGAGEVAQVEQAEPVGLVCAQSLAPVEEGSAQAGSSPRVMPKWRPKLERARQSGVQAPPCLYDWVAFNQFMGECAYSHAMADVAGAAAEMHFPPPPGLRCPPPPGLQCPPPPGLECLPPPGLDAPRAPPGVWLQSAW